MFSNDFIDLFFIFSILAMWGILFYHSFLLLVAYKFFMLGKARLTHNAKAVKKWPLITILIPAHNEELVIKRTIESILLLDYPKDSLQIIPINDSSSDKTGEIIDSFTRVYRSVEPFHIPPNEGGVGKSHTLNLGLKKARGEIICVFDADNSPEPTSLKYLVAELLSNPKYGAVCGKVRTQNRKKNLLTKFINLEFISHQWMVQGGRWFLHKYAMIPGTNFIIKKEILDELGGWDVRAIAEDAELTFQIQDRGYLIAFNPFAITWEQEPEKWGVWFKQRLRWLQGNQYIVRKYLSPKRLRLKTIRSLLYMIAIYTVLLFTLLVSDFIFLGGVLGFVRVTISGPLFLTWLTAFLLFVTATSVTLSFEETSENTIENFGVTCLMYFTYCQMWLVLSIRSFFIKSPKKGEKTIWVKTPRVKLEGG